MKIYTKTGDSGTTSLLGGQRVSKADPRIDAYGTVDELNSWMGLLRDHEEDETQKVFLAKIQEKLFTLGSRLAADPNETRFPLPKITEKDITVLEQAMDRMDEELPPLKNFILPGGHPVVSTCHLARTTCRRAERRLAELANEPAYQILLRYLNRLSDYLFVLARYLAKKHNAPETPWLPEK